jgi:hypothetical protein
MGNTPALVNQSVDSLAGEYCPLPAPEGLTRAPAADRESSATLPLYGQSAVPDSTVADTCAGVLPTTAIP